MSEDSRKYDEELPAYVAGRLEAEQVQEVESWLAEHPDRAELVEDWKRIAQGLRQGGAALAGDCPPATRLIAWARGHRTDPTGEFHRHVGTCAACSLEVEAAQRNRPRRSEILRPISRVRGYRVAGFAAAAGIALGLGLGLVLDRRSIEEADRLASGGAVDLLQLQSGLRSGAGAARYRPDPSQPYVPIATIPELPPRSQPQDLFRFRILEAGGGEVWSQELTAAAIESHLAVSGVLVLLVPAQSFSPGEHTLIVEPAGYPDALPLLRVPFVID